MEHLSSLIQEIDKKPTIESIIKEHEEKKRADNLEITPLMVNNIESDADYEADNDSEGDELDEIRNETTELLKKLGRMRRDDLYALGKKLGIKGLSLQRKPDLVESIYTYMILKFSNSKEVILKLQGEIIRKINLIGNYDKLKKIRQFLKMV
jgi:hypothetical protein